MLSYADSKSTTSYVLLNMNVMSTSNFEYELRFRDIKRSMNDSILLIFLNTHYWSLVQILEWNRGFIDIFLVRVLYVLFGQKTDNKCSKLKLINTLILLHFSGATNLSNTIKVYILFKSGVYKIFVFFFSYFKYNSVTFATLLMGDIISWPLKIFRNKQK